jgi:uncharacterized protein (TIGR02246 family)
MKQWVVAVGLLLAGVVGPTVTTHAQDGAHHAGAMGVEARLRRAEDIESIRSLLVAYGRFFDARDFAAYSNLFAEDGVWVGGDGGTRYEGPAAIKAMVDEGYPPSVFPGGFHLMTSFSIELTGPDSATAWSRWTFVIRDDAGNLQPFRAGHYEDVLVRGDGDWKFQSRRVVAE